MSNDLRTHFQTPLGRGWLQSPWDCVVGKKTGSRRTSVRLRALFTSGLAHMLFARPRFKISFEMSSNQISESIIGCDYTVGNTQAPKGPGTVDSRIGQIPHSGDGHLRKSV
jgi:hypothetical protein